uniref:Adenylyl-sulfate kinase n=1 Tax=Leersia perrieri TaxID=77586 RepID=A0A0D9X0M5_9ORYZ
MEAALPFHHPAASSSSSSSTAPHHAPRLAPPPPPRGPRAAVRCALARSHRSPANLGLPPPLRLRLAPSPSPRRAPPVAVVECATGREEHVVVSLVGEDKVVQMSSTVPKASNIFWHDCAVGQADRQKLLKQKGCVVWITGLSGSGFTGIDDPYEPPLNSEIEIKEVDGVCPSPSDMAGQIVTYLEEKGFLHE